MPRNRRSAKQAGARFERSTADFLRAHVDDRIDRRVQAGARDTGDIGGVRLWGKRVVIECKDTATLALPQWFREAEIEAANDDAAFWWVVHKKRGSSDPADQYASTSLSQLAAVLSGGPV